MATAPSCWRRRHVLTLGLDGLVGSWCTSSNQRGLPLASRLSAVGMLPAVLRGEGAVEGAAPDHLLAVGIDRVIDDPLRPVLRNVIPDRRRSRLLFARFPPP